jgi:hypothetical protein
VGARALEHAGLVGAFHDRLRSGTPREAGQHGKRSAIVLFHDGLRQSRRPSCAPHFSPMHLFGGLLDSFDSPRACIALR